MAMATAPDPTAFAATHTTCAQIVSIKWFYEDNSPTNPSTYGSLLPTKTTR
jgi:hypothetical protein